MSKLNSVISFFIGLSVSAAVIGFVSIVAGLLTFDLGGGETLGEVESKQKAELLLSIILFALALAYGWRCIKKGKTAIAIGIILVPFATAIAMTVYIVREQSTTRFDRSTWIKSERKPDDMAKGLVKGQTLKGLSRTQVKQLLGNGSEEYGDDKSDRGSIIYSVENNWTLSILFEKDKVTATEMRQPFLGV